MISQTSWPYTWHTVLPWGPLSYWSPVGAPLVAALLVVVAALYRARLPRVALRHAAAWTVLGILISLGTVEWGSHQFDPLSALAGQSPLRIAQRLGAGGLIGISLLAGLGMAALITHWSSVGRLCAGVVVVGAIYAEYSHGAGTSAYARLRMQTFRVVGGPFPAGFLMPAEFLRLGPLPSSYPIRPLQVSDDSPLIELLRRETGPVLELPVSRADALAPFLEAGGVGRPDLQAEAMLRSVQHWRPLLNGHSSFFPATFRDRMGWIRRLPDDRAVEALSSMAGLRSIVVKTDLLDASQRQRWLSIGSGSGRLRLVGTSGRTLVFDVSSGAE